jgi:hypothetical protein
LTYSDVAQNGKYDLHRSFLLKEVKITNGGNKKDAPHALLVQTKEKTFRVCFTGEQLKLIWLQKIDGLALERKNRGDTVETEFAAMWDRDDAETKCKMCFAEFSLFKRRHHCRSCGVLCCDNCSLNRVLLPNIDQKKKLRVCDKCVYKTAQTAV